MFLLSSVNVVIPFQNECASDGCKNSTTANKSNCGGSSTCCQAPCLDWIHLEDTNILIDMLSFGTLVLLKIQISFNPSENYNLLL